MRPEHITAILVILAFALQGCGHKGPLTLPPPQAKTSGPQTASPQKSDLPSSQQNPTSK
jgi:predicted small lipoprotein YifL